MRLECPEFRRGRGPVNLISRRALRSFAGKTSELEPMNLPQRNAASTKINNAAVSGQQGDAAGNTESAESPCGFDLEVVVFHYANGVPLTEGADALKVIFTIDLAPSF